MERMRQTPEQLLWAINGEDAAAGMGKLKIFFGYAAGVGKTYAMLEAAHEAKKRGIDVVAGYVEPHARPKTIALLTGLERIPNLVVTHNGITLKEFDLDAAIRRHPKLVLVDELAHTNGEGLRHTKRYQDVEELLKAGIDVYTTVNVQHIESLNDIVASVTGVLVRERIPDSVFDRASQVELVDIEPQELLERLNAGEIYQREQVGNAKKHFFTVKNLTALREIALRRCADRVNLISENGRIREGGGYHTEEHILVCLSSSPSNARIIRTAARMANAFHSAFSALYVETPEFPGLDEEDKKRLGANMRLAEQLGAEIEMVHGEDIPFQIAEFARLSGVSKIVIGRSMAARRSFLGKPALTEKLIAHAPDLDIHIIPDSAAETAYRFRKHRRCAEPFWNRADIMKSFLMLLFTTGIGFLFDSQGFNESNVIMVYILGTLFTSVITTHRMYSLVSSVVSVMLCNFFFVEPKFRLISRDKDYPVTLIVMFLVAFITGSLAVRLKRQAKQSAQAAYRTKVLFDANQLLEAAGSREEIIAVTAGQLRKLLNRDIIMYPSEGEELLEPAIFYVNGETEQEPYVSENERAVAAWVLKNNKRAGATTDTLSSARCLYLSIRVREHVYGVVGIVMGTLPFDAFEKSILLSILGECALALENERNRKEKEEAAIRAEKEQLRANLLRSISHDLRTPLTSISGNASNLISCGDSLDEETKMQLYRDMQEDAMWLINLVENLLSVTRIEEGRMNLHLEAELMDEVIEEALSHVSRGGEMHHIRVESGEEFLLARMDARLIVQVLINIVDNAIKYTPPDSHIVISAERKKDKAMVRIEDDGPGISDEEKPRVFDMFYSGANRVADSRRSLGLGLSLCRSIVHAHGGEICVSDNVPHGAVFTFTLPLGEVKFYE